MLVVVIASFFTQLCSWGGGGEVNKEKIVGYTIHSWGCGVICSHTHARTCTQSHICTHSHTHTRTHTHSLTDTHARTHTHTNQPRIKLNFFYSLKTIFLKLVNERTTPPMHIWDGSGWGQVPPLRWREWEEEYICRRPERETGVEEVDRVETEACKSMKFEPQQAASGATQVLVWYMDS